LAEKLADLLMGVRTGGRKGDNTTCLLLVLPVSWNKDSWRPGWNVTAALSAVAGLRLGLEQEEGKNTAGLLNGSVFVDSIQKLCVMV